MLARGFTIAQMVELVRAGLATAQAKRVMACKSIEVARVETTERSSRCSGSVARLIAGAGPVRASISVTRSDCI
jgi:hypothetical protein